MNKFLDDILNEEFKEENLDNIKSHSISIDITSKLVTSLFSECDKLTIFQSNVVYDKPYPNGYWTTLSYPP